MVRDDHDGCVDSGSVSAGHGTSMVSEVGAGAPRRPCSPRVVVAEGGCPVDLVHRGAAAPLTLATFGWCSQTSSFRNLVLQSMLGRRHS